MLFVPVDLPFVMLPFLFDLYGLFLLSRRLDFGCGVDQPNGLEFVPIEEFIMLVVGEGKNFNKYGVIDDGDLGQKIRYIDPTNAKE